MPKLDGKTAKTVDNTESNSFELVPEGPHELRLRSVEVKAGKEFPYWSWEFDALDDDQETIGRVWTNTSLSPAAAFKMKEMFDAFDVPANTDTDLLCGQSVKGYISHRPIESGSKKGEMGTNVDKVVKLDTDGGQFDDSDDESL